MNGIMVIEALERSSCGQGNEDAPTSVPASFHTITLARCSPPPAFIHQAVCHVPQATHGALPASSEIQATSRPSVRPFASRP